MAPNGYAWWYVDGLSDDGARGITLIAFLGSVFSPWYALARRRRLVDPLEHSALNVALYGAERRWAMTERSATSVRREASRLAIGPSHLAWDGEALVYRIDEVTAPWPSRLRGTVRVVPDALTRHRISLDRAGRHRWHPIAPSSRIEVRLDQPRISWSGRAYLDTNDGDEPLEAAFARWHWCRAQGSDGTSILYESTERDGRSGLVSIHADRGGEVRLVEPPPAAELPRTGIWRMPRPTRAEPGFTPRVVRTLEDAPFYSRSVVRTRLRGEETEAVHESLDLGRFAAPWTQLMLPFKAPRRR